MSLFSDKYRKKCNFCFLYRKKSVLLHHKNQCNTIIVYLWRD